MAEKKIISIGFEWPGEVIESHSLESNQSLLDGDIIVFQPDIYPYFTSSREIGMASSAKPQLSINSSVELLEDCYQWKSEIEEAIKSGKTIIVFLSKIQEVFIHKDVKRNHPYIGHFINDPFESKIFSNYDILPISIGNIVPKSAKEILKVKDSQIINSYWDSFGPWTESEIYIEKATIEPLLTTKDTKKVLGGYKRIGKGCFVFLPMLRDIEDEIVGYDPYEDRPVDYEKAVEVGRILRSNLLEIHKLLHLNDRNTTQPVWVSSEDYELISELRIVQEIDREEKAIAEFQMRINGIRSRIQVLEGEIDRETNLKRLLYETGKPLELSVIEALKILGFMADNYADESSEFDSIFTGPEGRFLGEAEGKDNSAIAVEKIRQLRTNLDEDFNKEDTNEYAKGVTLWITPFD